MPDLNSVPPSPYTPSQTVSRLHAVQHPVTTTTAAAATSRSTSTATPITEAASTYDPVLHILPSNQSNFHPSAASVSSPPLPPPATAMSHVQGPLPPHPPLSPDSLNEHAFAAGPGPLRHPKPLTASELHMKLEREQEQIVNRLSRELTFLRAAHNASVASNASSNDPGNEASLLSCSGFTIPNSRRHHRRTSSSASQTFSAQQTLAIFGGRRPSQPTLLTRQNSTNAWRSPTDSPVSWGTLENPGYFQQPRVPQVNSSAGSEQVSPGMMPGTLPATARYEETQYFKNELDVAKKENDTLKKRIKELERLMLERRNSIAQERRASIAQDRRGSIAGRGRSGSVSTTASVSAA